MPFFFHAYLRSPKLKAIQLNCDTLLGNTVMFTGSLVISGQGTIQQHCSKHNFSYKNTSLKVVAKQMVHVKRLNLCLEIN